MDAVHGYFQLALDEKRSMLTTFLLLQGKFRYLRAPIGLNGSTDEGCCRSDVLIHCLPWSRKIVDDTLIWADSYRELITRVKTVPDRWSKHNITISRKSWTLGAKLRSLGMSSVVREWGRIRKNSRLSSNSQRCQSLAHAQAQAHTLSLIHI